jgi:endo-1,4-beta-xylanase
MPTRRDVLIHSLQAGAALTLAQVAGLTRLHALQQQPVAKPAGPDEMTINSAPRPQVYPAPDFGPLPAKLPQETLAESGTKSLKAHAQQHGLIMGAAVVMRGLQKDPALQQLVSEQFGVLVPEGELKWRGLRPSQDRFDFAQSDALFAFAAEHHMLVRGHTLAWHNSVPDWLQNSPASLDVRKIFVEHIRTVMGRYRGRVHSWDVVNEAILPKDGQPGALRKSFWYDRVGHDYIDLAFRTAREADPHAKLTYNDYGVEYDNEEETERRARILEMLHGMQARKVPLDAVGIQAHIKAASQSTIGKGLAGYIEAIRRMGLEVYLTELDVNEDDITSNEVAVRDREVANTYRNMLDVALANPAVKLVLTWGVSNRRTWLNDGPTHHRKQPNRPQRSLPFDAEYRPTSAFFAVRDSIDARPRA